MRDEAQRASKLQKELDELKVSPSGMERFNNQCSKGERNLNFHWSPVEMKSGLDNPFTLRAAKSGLTILEIFYLQKHFLENI